jgi:hypothetical protein
VNTHHLISALLIAASSTMMSSVALGQSSKDYSLMPQAAWSAFECSTYAERSMNKKEQERLFTYGYKTGLKFIQAVWDGKVDKADFIGEMPMGFVVRAEGPTPDFVVGRWFEAVSDDAYKKLRNGGDPFPALNKVRAEQLYREGNCRLIGSSQ